MVTISTRNTKIQKICDFAKLYFPIQHFATKFRNFTTFERFFPGIWFFMQTLDIQNGGDESENIRQTCISQPEVLRAKKLFFSLKYRDVLPSCVFVKIPTSSRKLMQSLGTKSIFKPNLFSIQPSICACSSSVVIPSVYSSSEGLSSVTKFKGPA